jgi:hypothetical protein
MALFEGKTPSERNKLIAAIVLGALALVALSYMFFGSSSTPKRVANTNANARTVTTQTTATTTTGARPNAPMLTPNDIREQMPLHPIDFQISLPAVPEAGRNIFAFYVPPKPAPAPVVVATPTPAPPPPLMLSGISPTNVYARTGDFTVQVTGDKFTPAVRIYFGDAELATRFVNAQQLSANVPSPLIGYEGARQISVRTSDGALFSNTATLNVMAAPTPNYSFVGILGDQRYSDTAILKDKNSKQLINAQRGDVVGGRYRVTSISEREVWLTDTSLRIKHTLPFEGEKPGSRGVPPPYQPPRPADDDDDGSGPPVLEEP